MEQKVGLFLRNASGVKNRKTMRHRIRNETVTLEVKLLMVLLEVTQLKRLRHESNEARKIKQFLEESRRVKVQEEDQG